MRNLKLSIIKDKIKRKKFLKNELKKIILKSILQNFQLKDLNRSDALKRITFFKQKNHISYQNNICLITGRTSGVFKKYNISRHSIKNYAKFNFLQNTKIKSW